MVTVHIVYAFSFRGAKVLQKNNTADNSLQKLTNTTEFGAFGLFNRTSLSYTIERIFARSSFSRANVGLPLRS